MLLATSWAVRSEDGSGLVPWPGGYKCFLSVGALFEAIPLKLVVCRNSESVGGGIDLSLEYARNVPWPFPVSFS